MSFSAPFLMSQDINPQFFLFPLDQVHISKHAIGLVSLR